MIAPDIRMSDHASNAHLSRGVLARLGDSATPSRTTSTRGVTVEESRHSGGDPGRIPKLFVKDKKDNTS